MFRPTGAITRVFGSPALNNEIAKRIGVVVKGYPRLSETFIAQELLELERAGFELEIISLRQPADKATHPVHREIKAQVSYIPEYLHREPLRVLTAWRKVRKFSRYRAARAAFLADLRRDFTRNRFRRFGQGMVIAAEFTQRLGFLYAHFIHTPASATRYASLISGVRWAVSAHAKDIWTTPAWELAQKLGECCWCVTCTAGGRDELASHAPDKGKVHLVYHGLDLSRFPPPPPRPARDGASPGDPVRFLTIGRAVPKKGIDMLVAALAQLPDGLHWHWTHIGGGPLRDALMAQASSLGIFDRCTFSGALPQEKVLSAYRDHDLFVLPCRIDATGDRDGLPNVIVEAQSQGLAVLTTAVSGIPELIANNANGVFVDPSNSAGFAAQLEQLARDPALRQKLGTNGRKRVRDGFDHRATIGVLENLLRREIGTRPELGVR